MKKQNDSEINDYLEREALRCAALNILSNALTNGKGGWNTEFGLSTYNNLRKMVTKGDEDYCKREGNKCFKHSYLKECTICGKKM